MRRYFPGQIFRPQAVRKEPYYLQRKQILRLFGYRFWSREFLPRLEARAAQWSCVMSCQPSSSQN